MDGKTLARIGAVIFVALAITATAIEMNRPADRPDDLVAVAQPVTARDPLRAELARCGSIGEAGARVHLPAEEVADQRVTDAHLRGHPGALAGAAEAMLGHAVRRQREQQLRSLELAPAQRLARVQLALGRGQLR